MVVEGDGRMTEENVKDMQEAHRLGWGFPFGRLLLKSSETSAHHVTGW
jgi:hypothetical protein